MGCQLIFMNETCFIPTGSLKDSCQGDASGISFPHVSPPTKFQLRARSQLLLAPERKYFANYFMFGKDKTHTAFRPQSLKATPESDA
jgi:hypothetical protein